MTTLEHKNTNAIATVEVLTAEVRVLMVGSRQVTLSVFRQLDWVKLPDLDPFGRVNDGDADLVIGRKKTDGSLVRASVQWHGDPWTAIQQREFDQALRALEHTTKMLGEERARVLAAEAIRDDDSLSQ